jgi:hypothetical protein
MGRSSAIRMQSKLTHCRQSVEGAHYSAALAVIRYPYRAAGQDAAPITFLRVGDDPATAQEGRCGRTQTRALKQALISWWFGFMSCFQVRSIGNGPNGL